MFALGALAAALAGWVGLLPFRAGADPAAAVWAARGFLAMVLPGVAFGAWMAKEHGRAGSRFVLALTTGMIVRLGVAAIAATGAGLARGSAGIALLAGLAAGFVPMLLFETAWFAGSRGGKRLTVGTRG